MAETLMNKDVKSSIRQYLSDNPSAELIGTYLCFIEKKFNLQPVLFPKDKAIYQNADEVVKKLEKDGKLWHETEIKIGLSEEDVNEGTKRVYICPFSGKVFGDNTHPNPQDAIYDWVSKCPENTERMGGIRVKRFFVSEDPEVIKRYIDKSAPSEPITKVVYSSVLSGKLFNTKEAVIQDFRNNFLKRMSMAEVQSQNRFAIEEKFLTFIQEELVEEKIGKFVEALAEDEEFLPYVKKWVE